MQVRPQAVLLAVVMVGFMMIAGGMWAVDIGVSSMGFGANVTNGWWSRSAMQQYHIGLWSISVGAMVLAVCAITAVSLKWDR